MASVRSRSISDRAEADSTTPRGLRSAIVRAAAIIGLSCIAAVTANPAVAAIDRVLLVDVMSNSLSPLARWSELLERHQSQVAAGAECQGRLFCRDGWSQLVGALGGVGPQDLLSEVNRLVNRVRYVPDVADTWSTPTEFLRRGGDCEDFAIAKYLLLRQFGIPAAQMRIVVTRPPNSEPHAILLVETAGGTVALDNLRETPYAFGRQAASTMVYAFNEQSMWLPTGLLRVTQR
ncbi:MAG: transglutaminase-like cysteine peptidase [Bauldia sp.]|nr:transglutaminase-like cysteine peptidase [Bauldia sp.]